MHTVQTEDAEQQQQRTFSRLGLMRRKHVGLTGGGVTPGTGSSRTKPRSAAEVRARHEP